MINPKSNQGFFITGTDTDVGKTVIALGVIENLKGKGLRVTGFKPVSAGCTQTDDGLVNEDALRLQQASSVKFPYGTINPYAFEPAMAPHIAAEQTGIQIQINKINDAYKHIALKNDFVITEGAGGWLVPINDSETMADVALSLGLPILLVVGIRLGCLNHALMSVDCIKSSGCKLAGWIANQLTNDTDINSRNIKTLNEKIDAPLLATIPYQNNIEIHSIADKLRVPL